MRRQQAKAEECDRRQSRFEPEQHQQAAEFGQDGQRQQPPVDSVGLHLVRDASVIPDLADASTMKM
jgi:hypothetical protein